MVSVESAVIARISKGHEVFEILVDPDKALQFKKGIEVSIENMIAVKEVFKDSRKGERASSSELEEHFHTTDIISIATEILRKGELQLTTEQRKRLVAEKKKEVADIISRQGINPQTNLPHPQTRILNAMEEAHANIDPFKPARDQVKSVVEKIRAVLPISIERIEIAVRVPIQYAGKASSIIRTIAPVKSEEWKSDAWIAVIEIPAGRQAEVYEKLNEVTGGNVDIRQLKG